MSILSTIFKAKRYIKTDNGYQLFSEWQRASEVEFNNGSDAETTLGAINGITSSLNTNNDNYALSAAGGYNLQSQVTKLNTNLTKTNQTVAGNLTKTNQAIAAKQNKLNLISKSQGDITVGAGASRDFTFGISVPAGATIVAQIPILVTNAVGISIGRDVNKNFTARLWNSTSSEKNVGVVYYVIYYV